MAISIDPRLSRSFDYVRNLGAKNELQNIGIGGFNTLAFVRVNVDRSVDAPIYFVEDGSFAGDHIVIGPAAISIEGEVSDQFIALESSPPLDTRAREIIGRVNAFLPERTQAQTQRVTQLIDDFSSRARDLNNLINRTKNFAGYLGDLTGLNNEQGSNKSLIRKFIAHMTALRESKNVITIQTKHEKFDNMVVKLFSIEESNEVKNIKFRIFAEELRFTQTIFVQEDVVKNASDDLEGKVDKTINKGIQKGKQAVSSLLSDILG